MTKKNRKSNEDKEEKNQSAAIQPEPLEPVPAGAEAAQDELETPAEPASDSGDSGEASEELSSDDLLDEVRRSLMEEEEAQPEQEKGWWNRITRKGSPKDQEPEQEEAEPEIPVVDQTSVAVEPTVEEEAYVDQIDELIDMLETPEEEEKEEPQAETVVEPEPPVVREEPRAPVNVDEMKKRAFTKQEGEQVEEEDFSAVRAITLEEGGEEVFVEVESKQTDPMEERIKAFENAIRPYRRYIFTLITFLGVFLAIVAGALIFRYAQQLAPPEPTKAPSNLPYPAKLVLPGDIQFPLGKGSIGQDGKWNPRGAEWLEGTEICRWVAIPWSRQLEAVVRTLNQKDTIDLVMNNGDRITYTVYSIQQMTLAEMQKQDANKPCLLLVLAQQNVDQKWVVTALP